MMGRLEAQEPSLFYDFCLEDHVPHDHLLRQIAKVIDLSDIRQKLAAYYSAMGRPSLDPELVIRMLLIGYIYGIRSERRLVEEVHLNLAYRWFCGLGLKGEARTIQLFQNAAWPVPRQRCLPPVVRECASNLSARRSGQRRDVRHGRERD